MSAVHFTTLPQWEIYPRVYGMYYTALGRNDSPAHRHVGGTLDDVAAVGLLRLVSDPAGGRVDDARVAVAARLVEQVPADDGGVILRKETGL